MLNPKNLSVKEFSEKIKSDKLAVIIDVRTPEEFSRGHIKESLLIDFYNPNFQNQILGLDKSKNYYIYCRSGTRSFYAGKFMLQMGFNIIGHLEEGIIAWDQKIDF